MSINRGTNVDGETRQELHDMEVRIYDNLTKFRDEIISSVEKSFNKDVDYMKEKLAHYQDNHREHYENDKDRRKDIDALEKRISNLEMQNVTTEKVEEKADRKKELTAAQVGALCAVCSLVVGAIVYLIK